ncbi:MAG: ferrous iron transport protein B [Clostridia bacterium]|nr:ferrous iron transport protein B [Clostridia bacterium]
MRKSKTLNTNLDYCIALGGNPNVGKSTIFNNLTGMHQHTGNWAGKTVANASGNCTYHNKNFLFVDIPGTYSLMSNSKEEEIARNFLCFSNPDVTVIVVDATCLERQLNLVFQTMEITQNIVVCVNLLDEAKKKGISIDLNLLSKRLGVPVVGTIAKDKKTLNKLLSTVYKLCKGEISSKPKIVTYNSIIEDCLKKLLTKISKYSSIPKCLHRWVCLKLLDNSPEILEAIKNNFNISFQDLEKERIDCLEILEKENINFKDFTTSKIVTTAEIICSEVYSYKNTSSNSIDRKIDKILTSKKFGIPIMLFFLAIIFWITIIGANYPSTLLSNFFGIIQEKLLVFADNIGSPKWLSNMLILGIYQTITWIVAVMLPPMAIFFPLFTFLEDLGYLPRIAFNLDNYFKKACTSGKQMITMCMGFGCNACGVTGCRIITSPRERLIAILTNSFVPCNGRYPLLIAIATIFIARHFSGIASSFLATISVILVIILGIFMSLLISRILSKTLLKGVPSSFVLELPPYRKPQFAKIFVRSIFDRTLFVLGRALVVAAPAGLVIWLLANLSFNGASLLNIIANFFDPFAKLMGLDGYILTAFVLGIPANEIVLPIMLMCYMGANSLSDISDTFSIGSILLNNGWSFITALNVMIFTVLHFPCTTTLLTIKKETNSWKWTFLAFALPTVCGILLCISTNFVYNIFV